MTRESDFSEGMALAVLLAGHPGLPDDKVRVELAFTSCWRLWTYRGAFPFVGMPTKKDELFQITHADVRKHTMNFYWEHGGGQYLVRWRGKDLPDPREAAADLDVDIPAEAWLELGTALFDAL